MVAVKNILVPIDFSETSKHVLDVARMLADACGASLHLLHVIGYPLATTHTLEQERGDVCARLDGLLNSVDRERHATVSCRVGTPAREIVDYATERGTDLIVMGTHWHGPTFQMVGGSIAESVLGLAPCPVLAVKGAERGSRSTSDRLPATASM
jgi:nucleotide-binding universal stress UspA family protein